MPVSFTGFSPTSVFPAQKTAPTTLSAKPAQTTEEKFLEYAKIYAGRTVACPDARRPRSYRGSIQGGNQFPADQQKVEDKIRDMIKKRFADSPDKPTGMITDKLA